jgi:hypothetical protein
MKTNETRQQSGRAIWRVMRIRIAELLGIDG